VCRFFVTVFVTVTTSTASTQTQHQVERRFLLDVVVGQCAAVLQLLTRKGCCSELYRAAAYLAALICTGCCSELYRLLQ
jgi:undecaprenyl pyrophosphate phosphatase UppP